MRWIHVFNRALCRWVWTQVPVGVRVATFSGIGLCTGGALLGPLLTAPPADPPRHLQDAPRLTSFGMPPPWGFTPANFAGDPGEPPPPAGPIPLAVPGPGPLTGGGGGEGGGGGGDPSSPEPGPGPVVAVSSGQGSGPLPEPGSTLTLAMGWSVVAWLRRRRTAA